MSLGRLVSLSVAPWDRNLLEAKGMFVCLASRADELTRSSPSLIREGERFLEGEKFFPALKKLPDISSNKQKCCTPVYGKICGKLYNNVS